MEMEDEFSSGSFNLPENLRKSGNSEHDGSFRLPAGKFKPPPLPLQKSHSYNTLNARAQSFLPRTGSASLIYNTGPMMGQPSKMMGPPSPMRGPPSPIWGPMSPSMMGPPSPMLMGSPSPMMGPMSPMMMGPPSPMMGPMSPMMMGPPSPMMMGPQSPMRGPPSPMMRGPPSPIMLAGSSTTTTQKTSYVIPQPVGPPTLMHVFTTTTSLPSPTSPAMGFRQDILLSPGGMAPPPLSPAMVAALSMPPSRGDMGKGAAAMSDKKSWPLDEVSRKVLHQVEFYFSDLNVATTDHLIRYMNKDPEGYVPISVVASFKKIRSGTSSNAQLASILRNSEKLIVSDDGKRVKRVIHLTESYMEELQSRIVVAENLPRDHSHQNLMRIFSSVGSVNAIRSCQPSSGVAAPRTAKPDNLFHSTKLHAFVEYASLDLAEKAVLELTDKKNWRNGLKVRFLIRIQQVRSSPTRSMKTNSDNGSCWLSADESDGEEDGDPKRARGRGWGKGRERPQYQPSIGRGSIICSAPNLYALPSNEHNTTIKQAPRVPRMPDGTKGFSMGRGRLISARTI